MSKLQVVVETSELIQILGRTYPAGERTWRPARRPLRTVMILVLVYGAVFNQSVYADWPQILGPTRDGQSSDTTLSSQPPAKLWEHELGEGYAGPAIAGGKVVVFHRIGDEEVVEQLDLLTGSPIWEKRFDTAYRSRIESDAGPRCVPLIDGDRVYVFGPAGILYCLAMGSGDLVWRRDLYAEFRGDEGYFGAGSSPILVDGRLLLNVGGRREAGIVAFDSETGEDVWQTGDDAASYSSPTIMRLGEEYAVVFVTRLHAVGISPADGTELFRFEHGRTGPTVNAAMPLVCDGQLFVSSSYGVGARMVSIEEGSVTTTWANDRTMSSQYTTCVYQGGYLFGTHGREDQGTGTLRCINAADGEIVWEERDFGLAHLIAVGEQCLMLTVEGELISGSLSPTGFQEAWRLNLHRLGSRALPALANGICVSRSNTRNRAGKLVAMRVGEAPN